jgi:hypothetical protein
MTGATTDLEQVKRLLKKARDEVECGDQETAETLVWLALEELRQ